MSYLSGSFFQITDDAVTALNTTVMNKVDKITDKGLSTNDYDATAKGKVDALGTASTHAATDFATPSSLTALATRVTALETWKSLIKFSKAEAFTATSDASGLFSFTTSSTFTSPKIILTPQATAGTEGYEAQVTSVSGTTVNGIVFKNKTQAILLGGTIDPDAPIASTTVHGIVVQV